MMLNNFVSGTPMEFTKRCRLRAICSIGFIILGAAALVVSFLYGNQLPVLGEITADEQDFARGFYTGIGFGVIAAGLVTLIKNIRFLKNADLRKKRALYEDDERNRMIGTKCWAYAGYTLFLCLYVGILAAGFFNMTVLKVLLAVFGVYGGLLLIFKKLLQHMM